ncbi:MAG: 50S ribosomal protein L15 [Candidatus Xiphinematobacter sp.]|nr:MAG: 50S ribosomal protein L15 [Candidatus Xiphinematobacter sp.]
MRLHDLKPLPGAKHRKKRLGIGESSGHGKTSGRGHKGQRARSGGSIRPGFEGGQMPLIRRLPKRGFNNSRFKEVVGIVNVGDLEKFFEGGTLVNESILRGRGLIRGHLRVVKLLGKGSLTKQFSIEVDRTSTAAREKVEQAGGNISLCKRPLWEKPIPVGA